MHKDDVEDITRYLIEGKSWVWIAQHLGIKQTSLRIQYGKAVKLLQEVADLKIQTIQQKPIVHIYNEDISNARVALLKKQLKKLLPKTKFTATNYELTINVLPDKIPPNHTLFIGCPTSPTTKSVKKYFQILYPDTNIIATDFYGSVTLLPPPTKATDTLLLSAEDFADEDEYADLEEQVHSMFPQNPIISAKFRFCADVATYKSLLDTQESLNQAFQDWEPSLQYLNGNKEALSVLSETELTPEDISEHPIIQTSEWLRTYKDKLDPFFVPDWSEWDCSPTAENRPTYCGTLASIPLYINDPQNLTNDIILWAI